MSELGLQISPAILIGVLISIGGYFILKPGGDRTWQNVYIAATILHFAASIVFWRYSVNFGADSQAYYLDPRGYAGIDFRPGTVFIIKVVSAIRSIGGTYLDLFIIFQSFGLLGICVLARTIKEISEDLETPVPWFVLGVIFLPGLHFWSSSLGKDPPLILACSLSLWSMMRIQQRWPAALFALAIMAAVRPHIAAISILSIIAALMTDLRIRMSVRLPILAGAGILCAFLLSTVKTTLNISDIDPDSLTDFIASKQQLGSRTEAGAQITSLPLPLKIGSLLFRPLFFDASGVFGIFVSLENLIILAMFFYMMWNWKIIFRAFKSVVYIRYASIFSGTLILLLSLISYNVGLGLRQKFMAMPSIFIMFATIVIYREFHKVHTATDFQESNGFKQAST